MKIHRAKCPRFSNEVQVSSDGISENKSSVNVIDVYSSRFVGCRTVYPFQLVRPLGRYKVNHKEHLDNFLTNVCCSDCIIKCFVGDSPKRVIARDGMGHSSYFPCEYCFCKGLFFQKNDQTVAERKEQLIKSRDKVQQQIDQLNDNEDIDEEQLEPLMILLDNLKKAIKDIGLKGKGHVVWPSSTFISEPRTKETILKIVDKLEQNPKLSRDERKGIVGRSLFLDIPYFDIVIQIPAEYLHSVCLGVTKKLIELTFNVGENRSRITNRKLSSKNEYNLLIIVIKVPREFSRRVRALDFSVMKGQEFRNVLLFFFPIILKCIESDCLERRLWLLYVYMIRSCVIPDIEYNTLDSHEILTACKQFYELYEELFGVNNCTYYTHVVTSHLLDIRSAGPFTTTSAFGFESFYSEVRNSFVPGTQSPLKQIMRKTLIKRALGHHCCEKSIYYSAKDTAMECNNLIYIFANGKYHIYEINAIDEDILSCTEINLIDPVFPDTPNLNFNKVGVFVEGQMGQAKLISNNDVHGKVIRVDKYLITCPIDVLREK